MNADGTDQTSFTDNPDFDTNSGWDMLPEPSSGCIIADKSGGKVLRGTGGADARRVDSGVTKSSCP